LSKRAYGWMDGIAGPQRGRCVRRRHARGGGVSPGGEGRRNGWTVGRRAGHIRPCTGRRAGSVPLRSACCRSNTCQVDEQEGATHMHKWSVVAPHPPSLPIRTSFSTVKGRPASLGACRSGCWRARTCGAHISIVGAVVCQYPRPHVLVSTPPPPLLPCLPPPSVPTSARTPRPTAIGPSLTGLQ
jgi:hypothetical protein